MAARSEAVGGGSLGTVLAGGFIAAIIMAAGLVICGDALNNHAFEKHGTDATKAQVHIATNGDNCRYNCPDGRIRYACQMDDGAWALMVTEGNGEFVTAFTRGKGKSVENFLAGCTKMAGAQ